MTASKTSNRMPARVAETISTMLLTIKYTCSDCQENCELIADNEKMLREGYGMLTRESWRCPTCRQERYEMRLAPMATLATFSGPLQRAKAVR